MNQRGGILTELLLTVALAGLVLPFVARFQMERVHRAENIAITREIGDVQSALERYMDAHRDELMRPTGRNITRVSINALADYGAPESTILKYGDEFQLRILKSTDRDGHATLQGVIVLEDDEISPIRTRQIMNLGNGQIGFVQQGRTFGAFGTWRADAGDMGLYDANGIVGVTDVRIDQDRFLWRMPSENADDATMLSPMNLGGHNIVGANLLNAHGAEFAEILGAAQIVSDKIVFQNRTTIDMDYYTSDATVAGNLSADSRNLEIYGTLTLADMAKLSALTVDDLWVNNLNLSGLTVSSADEEEITTLSVGQTLDMVGGGIDVMTATVGFAGSITPKLVINNGIEDSVNPNYYWDADSSVAHFYDAMLMNLLDLAPQIYARENGRGTVAGRAFGTVSGNKNATAADFMNALAEIEQGVRTKFYRLNLE